MIDETTRDAERQVIGSILASDVLDDVLAQITTADIWDPRHALILEAAAKVREDGHPVEPITVADQLGSDLGRAGGMSYLLELHGCVITASSAGYIAEKVLRAESIRRTVVAAGHRIVGLGTNAGADEDPLDVVDAVRAELDAVATGRTETSAAEDVYAALELLEQEIGDPTPWRDLTEAIGGWRPGCLYYIGARPGVGKSVIAVGAALDMARRGKHAHIASLEMSKHELWQRMLCSTASVDNHRMTHRELTDKDWHALSEAAAHLSKLPITVNDSGAQRVSDIRAKSREIARTGTLGMVVVDYLQLMSSGGRVESRQQEVAGFSRALKLLAKELEVPVVALSQLNRGLESRADKMPALSDLRESGSLEQDADGVLLLHRDDDESPDLLQLLVGKNRHGPSNVLVRLRWEGHHFRATDFAPQSPATYYERTA